MFLCLNFSCFVMPRYIKSAQRISAGFAASDPAVATLVSNVISDIRSNGDAAVQRYSAKFDQWTRASFKLSQKEIDDVIAQVSPQIISDIKEVQANVKTFALAQLASLTDFELEVRPGVFLGQMNNPINRVGWYDSRPFPAPRGTTSALLD